MIPPAQLRILYVKTTQQYRRDPNDDEFESWIGVLSGYKFQEISQALDRWLGDTTLEEFTNRPKGARMPSPAEIKLSVQTTELIQGEKFKGCGQDGCMNGWVREFEGMTVGGNKIDPKVGAARRCKCFYEWCASRKGKGVSRQEQTVGG